ncbi:hypothetical protein V495_02728 [Pseudogymnoascus sp. VKM F-4514 (FW-929)]|nr:hypothetical protein V495_02728 [Pseudogymnoascus sp. VKM F-4514 (FW-929)]KFY62700.1 hypothetical protein V497_02268 [Pseudogymnoascus sp. VKM F-4516 (FW-969)]
MSERAYATPVSPEVTKASPAPASPVQSEIDKASASLASLAQPEVDLMSDFEPYAKESEHEVLNLKFPALKIQKNGLCSIDNAAKLKRPTDMDSLTEKEPEIDLIQTSPLKSPLKASGPTQTSESTMAKPAAQYYHKHDPDQPGFNLETFRNPYSKKYKCAFAGCTKLLNSSQALYMHLQSNAHLTELSTCPTCLNQFNSGAALMQHLESQTNRCNARDGRHFRQLIDQVAAGMVDTAGTHDDNTHKFYSARIVPKLALDTVHEAKDEIVISAVNDPEYRADRVREREQKLQEEKDRLDEWHNEDWAY